jgi:predicted MFS family arabinose efflux permease
MAVPKQVIRASRYFVAATMVSSLDRAVIAPMMLGIAADFKTGIATIATGTSAYLLAYGLTQPIWGMWSDRLGRIRTIQLSLSIGGIADLICMVNLSMNSFFAVRTIAGFGMAAAFPASLIYLSDSITLEKDRQPVITRLTAGVAIGLVAGTVLGGIFVENIGWRWIFGIIGVTALFLAWAIRAIPNTIPEVKKISTIQTYKSIYKNKWTNLIYILVLIEGMVLLGLFTLTVPALEQKIHSASISGLVTSVYGVSVLVMSFIVAKLSREWPALRLFTVGGISAVIGFAILAYRVSLWSVAVSVFFQGIAWVFFHTTLQTWITSIKIPGKSTAISLFAAYLFIGNALGSTFSGVALQHYGTVILYSFATILSAVMCVLGIYWRRIYNRLIIQ